MFVNKPAGASTATARPPMAGSSGEHGAETVGAKAGVAIGVVTALLGAGGAAVGVMVVREPAAAPRRAAVVRADEGDGLADTGAGPSLRTRPVVLAAPSWDDDFGHVVVTGAGAPTVEAPAGVADRGADTVLLARVKALDGVVAAEVVGPRTLAVTTDRAVPALRSVPGVVAVGDDVPMGATADPDEPAQWHLANTGRTGQSGYPAVAGADVDAARAWTVSEGAGVIVAVVDTGVALTHPDLADRLWTNPADPCGNGVDDDRNGLVDDCRGWDFGRGDNDPSPEPGLDVTDHGSHVAGIVAAARNGTGVVGLAPAATIMPLKVSAGGTVALSKVATAVRYAVDHGARVVNLSLATGLGTPRADAAALEAAVAYAASRGVLVVAGAGNDATDLTAAPSLFPAAFALWYPNVVAVGASGPTDRRAAFSNYGWPAPALVYAPGSAIASTFAEGWGRMSGTSMAAPVVSGVAALVLASGRAGDATAVRDLLAATAEATPAGPRVDAAVALGLARAVPPTPATTAVPTTSAPTTAAPTTAAPTATTAPRRTASPTAPVRPTPTTVARTTAPTAATTVPRPATTRATVPPPTTTTVAPLVTTPTPTPARTGSWALETLSVRSSPLGGGTPVTATGVFPTDVPVEVWFSGVGPSVPATVAPDGRSLTFVTPALSLRTVTEVTVRFTRQGRLTRLTLRNAMTFAPNG